MGERNRPVGAGEIDAEHRGVADQLTEALSVFVALCPHVVSTYDLVTKVRIELEDGYILDLFYREHTGQDSYALLRDGKKVIGWDNAPHHLALPNAPHHFHDPDEEILPSPLTGNPPDDMPVVAERINALYAD
jgi:hypothetical protein